MIKKILFITFIVFISIFVSNLLKYNSEIVITYLGYQITTTTGFLIFLITCFILSVKLLINLVTSIFNPNFKNYKKLITKNEKIFNQYLELLTESFIYKSAMNIKESFTKLKKANKIYKQTNLSRLLESQIYYTKKEYDKSQASFKEIKDINLNLNLLNLRINLEQAKKNNNIKNIEKYSEEILKIEPINKSSLESLFEIYTNQKEWEKANDILQIALKSNIFDIKKQEKKILFIYTSLGKIYYDRMEFIKAKNILRLTYKLDNNCIQSLILLIKTYIALGKKSKALKLIKKTWKYNTNPYLAELYFSLFNKNEKKSIKIAENLYKLNCKSFESNLIMAEAYFNEENYSKARKYAKIAENINSTKSIYELMLKIEQNDNGNSTLMANLKNKILNTKIPCWKCNICNREYINWQPECNNCKHLNSLEWTVKKDNK